MASRAYESHHPPDAIERQVVDLLRQKQLADSVIISSFNVKFLEQIASMKQAPAIAFISENPADEKTVQMCTRLKVFSWHPDHKIVTPAQVELMHARGIKVFPWTVNELEDFDAMQDLKVEGVITNDPMLAARWAGMNNAS